MFDEKQRAYEAGIDAYNQRIMEINRENAAKAQ
jgi:hypothetical protein